MWGMIRKGAWMLAAILVMASCKSPEKLLVEGRYDEAIERSIKRISDRKYKDDDVRTLDKAYQLANDRDKARIERLHAENNPNRWEEVYDLLNRLKNRQDRVLRLMPLKFEGRTLKYERINYDEQIVEAKCNAADFFAEEGIRLMNQKNKESYRRAWVNFDNALYYKCRPDTRLEELMKEAAYKGTSRVLVRVKNASPIPIPDRVFKDLLVINTDGLNSQWVEYFFDHRDNRISYDYVITVNLTSVLVTPDKVTTNDYIEEKIIDDGWEYAKDRRGNVLKDSLGNDIKMKKTKTLRCTVIETRRFKSGRINGVMEYVQVDPQKIDCQRAYFQRGSVR